MSDSVVEFYYKETKFIVHSYALARLPLLYARMRCDWRGDGDENGKKVFDKEGKFNDAIPSVDHLEALIRWAYSDDLGDLAKQFSWKEIQRVSDLFDVGHIYVLLNDPAKPSLTDVVAEGGSCQKLTRFLSTLNHRDLTNCFYGLTGAAFLFIFLWMLLTTFNYQHYKYKEFALSRFILSGNVSSLEEMRSQLLDEFEQEPLRESSPIHSFVHCLADFIENVIIFIYDMIFPRCFRNEKH